MGTKDKSISGKSLAVRKAYEPPAVVESAEFETLALACGKTSTLIPSCNPYDYTNPGTLSTS